MKNDMLSERRFEAKPQILIIAPTYSSFHSKSIFRKTRFPKRRRYIVEILSIQGIV